MSAPPARPRPPSVARILQRALGLSRREIRRRRLFLIDENGQRLDAVAHIALDGHWSTFRLGSMRIDARMSVPPAIALHKPRDVVVSHDEPNSPHPTLYEAFPDLPDRDALRAVGRLDALSEGLLLLTADGQLLHRLTHPGTGPERAYAVNLDVPPAPSAILSLRDGTLALRDGHRPRPLRVGPLSGAEHTALLGATTPAPGEHASPWWFISLRSGRYHEVRRAFAACGTRVERLIRVAYGPVRLAEVVPEPGAWALLDDPLRDALYAAVGLAPAPTWLETRSADGESDTPI